MEFSSIVKAYIEIGILGLCGCAVVFITILNYFRNKKHSEEQDKSNDKRFDDMLSLIQEQNQKNFEQNNKNYELLMNKLMSGVSPHTLTAEEDEKLSRVNDEINKILQQLLIKTGASRANLVQYHNGGKGKNNQSFLKMSMTNEVTNLGVKPVISEFKDQFRNVLAYFVKEIGEKGFCYIPDFEKIKATDYSMYEFLSDRGVQAKFGVAIHSDEGVNNVIGFVCLEFLDKTKADVKVIDEILKQKASSLETLLNL